MCGIQRDSLAGLVTRLLLLLSTVVSLGVGACVRGTPARGVIIIMETGWGESVYKDIAFGIGIRC